MRDRTLCHQRTSAVRPQPLARWVLLGCLIILLGSVRPVQALFCGARVISEGASKLEVLQKCGDPTFAEQRISYETVYVYPGGYAVPPREQSRTALPPAVSGWGAPAAASPVARDRTPSRRSGQGPFVPLSPPQPVVVAVLTEEWIYNFGPHSLLYRLHFADGVLRSITTLNYGY
ncbi:MAG: DUF2845 domain-containing protein [Candidatus Tectimicrobiota bacterium]